MTRPFVLDMETSDPDDFLTLLLLLGHPEVDLVAVTVTPGTREQVSVVRQALQWFGRGDIPVGAYDLLREADCVSDWHYRAFPQLLRAKAEADEGWRVLDRHLGPGVTMVEGAAPKNLGRLVRQMSLRIYDQTPCLGRLFFQGGFAGEGVVPPERQLDKFRGKATCPSFNPNGDPQATLDILANRMWFEDLRFVSKNVCHGVKYDRTMHARFGMLRSTWCGHSTWDECTCDCHLGDGFVVHCMPCCGTCSCCGMRVHADSVGVPRGRTALAQSLIYQGMSAYLAKHKDGKAFHDPLAACCAIDPSVGEWAEVELYRERGEWGSRLSPGSPVRIITGYDHERFVGTLLRSAPVEGSAREGTA